MARTIVRVLARRAIVRVIRNGIPVAIGGAQLGDDLTAIEALTGTGVARRTGDGVWTLDTTGATGLALLGAASAAAARTTLELGDSATRSVGTTAGTVAAGDHAHSGVYQPLNGELSAIAALAGLGALHRTADDTVVTRTLQWVTLHDGVGPYTYTAGADDVLCAIAACAGGGSGGSGALQSGVTTRTGGTGGQGGEAADILATPAEANGWVATAGAGGPAKAGRSGSDGDGVSGDAGGSTTVGPYTLRGGSGGLGAVSGANRAGGGSVAALAVTTYRLQPRLSSGLIVGGSGDVEAPPASGCGGGSLLGSTAYGGHDGGPYGGPGGGGGGGLSASAGMNGGAGGTVGTTARPSGGTGGTTGQAGTDGAAVAGQVVGTGGGGGGGNHTGQGGDGGDGGPGAGGGGGGSGRATKGGDSGKGGDGRIVWRVLRWVTT